MQKLSKTIKESRVNEAYAQNVEVIDDISYMSRHSIYNEDSETVGLFGVKTWAAGRAAGLYNLDSYDREWIGKYGVKLKPGEFIFRYNPNAGVEMKPLVKINLEKGLIYFISEKGNELDEPIFDGRGIKLTFLKIWHEYLSQAFGAPA